MNKQPMLWSVVSLFVFALGCSRAPVMNFSYQEGFADLPEQHQGNLSDGLLRLFGTPANPRQRMVDEESEEPDEGQPTPLVDDVAPKYLQHGAKVYNARCAGCHGITGDGAGPAGEFLRPRPRDYRRGIFKFTSTPYGLMPARHDLVRTIRRGAKGTSMPAFPWMSDADLNAVIDYVVYLSIRGKVEIDASMMSDEYDEDEDIDFVDFIDALDSAKESWADAEDEVLLPASAEPAYDEETVLAGRKLFLTQGCAQCHGIDGKGQVEWINPEFLAKQEKLPEAEREKLNYDAWGEPAPAADLTARMLHGGRRPIDVYRRIHTGINGTPMPAFGSIFAEEPEKLWHLVHYVQHVIEGGDPTVGITSVEPEVTDAQEEMSPNDEQPTVESEALITADDSNENVNAAASDEESEVSDETAEEEAASSDEPSGIESENQPAEAEVLEPVGAIQHPRRLVRS